MPLPILCYDATDAHILGLYQAGGVTAATQTLNSGSGTTVALAGTANIGEFTVTVGAGHADFSISDVRINRGTGTLNDNIQALQMKSITTQAFASAAITALDSAISSVNEQRASYGSHISRLEHAASNLSNISQNTQFTQPHLKRGFKTKKKRR